MSAKISIDEHRGDDPDDEAADGSSSDHLVAIRENCALGIPKSDPATKENCGCMPP
jgi:hypothetical protein